MADNKKDAKTQEFLKVLKDKEATGNIGKGLEAQRSMAKSHMDYIRSLSGKEAPPMNASALDNALARNPAARMKGSKKLMSLVPGLGLGLAAYKGLESGPAAAAEELAGQVPVVGSLLASEDVGQGSDIVPGQPEAQRRPAGDNLPIEKEYIPGREPINPGNMGEASNYDNLMALGRSDEQTPVAGALSPEEVSRKKLAINSLLGGKYGRY